MCKSKKQRAINKGTSKNSISPFSLWRRERVEVIKKRFLEVPKSIAGKRKHKPFPLW
jgi:hypothetical protein